MNGSPARVWIDTDAAIGVPNADVDDGLALIQAFHSPEITVCGVSAVFGNAPLEDTLPTAREVVRRFGPADCPVLAGAASADQLGGESDAVRGMAEALGAGPLHLLAIGPVTNVGSLLALHPELAVNILSVVAVAARRPGQRFLSTPEQPVAFPDLNFDCDPPAMQGVIDCGVPLVFAPWEVSSHVWLLEEDLDWIEKASPSGAYVAQHSRMWLEMWQRDLRAPGFNPFDTLAVAALTHPGLLRSFDAGVWIEEGPDDASTETERAGRIKPHLLVDEDRAGPRARYCFEPEPQFKPLLLERLCGPPDA